jgi:hypothetical protein
MAKGRSLPLKAPIEGKLYKNSECSLCGCFLCVVKVKYDQVMCHNCFKIESRKDNDNSTKSTNTNDVRTL